MSKFLKNEDGLVTIEWIGIAAVMVLAAVGVTAFIMTGTGEAGDQLVTGVQAIAEDASDPGTIPFSTPADD